MQHDVSYEAEQGPSQRRSSEHRSVPRNERFIPVTSPVLIDGLIFACSVLHCIVGSLLVIIGVISLPIVPHFTSSIALPIYPGSIVSILFLLDTSRPKKVIYETSKYFISSKACLLL